MSRYWWLRSPGNNTNNAANVNNDGWGNNNGNNVNNDNNAVRPDLHYICIARNSSRAGRVRAHLHAKEPDSALPVMAAKYILSGICDG